jgi:hypothetical protein
LGEVIVAGNYDSVGDETIDKETRESLVFLLFKIWKMRSNRTFREAQHPHETLTTVVIEAVA